MENKNNKFETTKKNLLFVISICFIAVLSACAHPSQEDVGVQERFSVHEAEDVDVEEIPESQKEVEKAQELRKEDALSSGGISQPLMCAQERITKKPFGIFINPATSPVQPERFSGYHTGTDFEVFDDELDVDISVFAICDGKILSLGRVGGYGGVITQVCMIDNNEARVLYGHVSLTGAVVSVGQNVSAGEKLTVLGAHKSRETDGERKHLHLSIVKGSQIDLRGYVKSEGKLRQWVDFEKALSF